MKYKPGDEVLVKAEVTDVHEGTDKPYFVMPNFNSVDWVSEEKIIPMDKTYADGLSDAWELARRLYALRPDEREEMFKYSTVKAIIEDCTIEEVMDYIESYEKEKSEIKVGDVIEYKNTLKAVVTRIENCDEVYVLWGDGSCGKMKRNEAFKIGKTADGLMDLLRQIGE